MKIWIVSLLMMTSFYGYAQEMDVNQLINLANKVDIKPTTPEEPVSMNAVILSSEEKKDDKTFLIVKVKIHENWHIYAYVPQGGFFIQSELELDLPEGMDAKLVIEPKTIGYDADPQIMLYKGELLFVYEISKGNVLAGEHSLKTTLLFQPCDPYSCLPPNEITVKNQLSIIN